MKIRLYHGRNSPEQKINGWGFDGPILNNVEGIVFTYGIPRVFFDNELALEEARKLTGWEYHDDGLEMRVFDEFIETKDGFFGDWELY